MKKGPRFEKQACDYLGEVFPGVERRVMGGAADTGDVAGLKVAGENVVLQLRCTTSIELAKGVEDARKQAARGSARWWAVVFSRRMKNVAESYVVMPLALYREMLTELDGGL